MRCLKFLLAGAAIVAAPALSLGQTNLPLGLPADQLIPTNLSGYKLVSLDRSKEVVFDIKGERVVVEVPLFIYLPESDKAAEMRDALKAIHGDLARLASQREQIDPERLMTLFLALDAVLAKPDPVSRPVKDSRPVSGEATNLQKAIDRTDG